MLNWERDKRNHMAVEQNYDFLPATGSFADQRRWAKEKKSHFLYKKTKPINYVFSNGPISDCEQLASYVKCVESSYFWKKPSKDQEEIIGIIRKLIDRINPKIELLGTQNQCLLRKAQAALLQFAN